MRPLPGLIEAGFGRASINEANAMLRRYHYLGPISSGKHIFGERAEDGHLVQVQVWRHPTARQVPTDWLELSRWCIGPEAGHNAGSRMMGWVRKQLRGEAPVLVSYSELGHHDGALYKASGWTQLPTHIAIRWLKDGRGYPSGNGSWSAGMARAAKMRWVIELERGAL